MLKSEQGNAPNLAVDGPRGEKNPARMHSEREAIGRGVSISKTSHKHQAASIKHQAFQASSSKHQAPSNKHQATSRKQQAARY
jgi:hypothetical protein